MIDAAEASRLAVAFDLAKLPAMQRAIVDAVLRLAVEQPGAQPRGIDIARMIPQWRDKQVYPGLKELRGRGILVRDGEARYSLNREPLTWRKGPGAAFPAGSKARKLLQEAGQATAGTGKPEATNQTETPPRPGRPRVRPGPPPPRPKIEPEKPPEPQPGSDEAILAALRRGRPGRETAPAKPGGDEAILAALRRGRK